MAGDLSDYPACTWNAGTRTNDPNAVGRLVPISDDVAASNQAMRSSLAATEPLYCSPMGSLLDDVGYTAYAIGRSGLHRLPTLVGAPGSNFIFSPVRADAEFLAYADRRALAALRPTSEEA